MPVINAKRFMDVFPFDAGPVGRLGFGKEGMTLAGCARAVEEDAAASRELFSVNRMAQARYLLQQIFLNFR
jgi:hypothetical protein